MRTTLSVGNGDKAEHINTAKDNVKSYTLDELCDVLKDDGKSYKEMREEYLSEKYGV